jgi:hypothetical protein
MILSCSCKSEYQDKRYGAGKRVKNPCKDGARCTVCVVVDRSVKGDLPKTGKGENGAKGKQ